MSNQLANQDWGFKPVFLSDTLKGSPINNDISQYVIKKEIYNCHACELSEYDKDLTTFNFQAPIMIVGDKPSDILPNSENGKVFRKLLEKRNISLNHVHFTSAVKCEESQCYSTCASHLLSEIILLKPSVILACGYYTCMSLLPDKNMPLQPGSGFQIMKSIDVLPTYSIRDTTENPNTLQYFESHLDYAIQHARSKHSNNQVQSVY